MKVVRSSLEFRITAIKITVDELKGVPYQLDNATSWQRPMCIQYVDRWHAA